MSDPTPASQESIYGHMIRGSAWGIGLRLSVRGIGLVSTLILARILVPADFGIVAMATMIYGLLEVFFEMGVDLYLIRSAHLTRDDWNTAWTFRVLQGLALAGLLLVLAPLGAQYFDEPRVVEVIDWLALAAVMRGLQNIGVVRFRKDLDFASDFRFGLYGRLATFCITVPAAVILRTYWALVIGQVAGVLIQTLLSYRMHSFRPRLSLARGGPLIAFSLPVVLLSATNYLINKIDSFVVGGIADSARLGPYALASGMALMFSYESVAPISRALFPSYAKIIDDPSRFRPAYMHSIRAVAIISCATSVGLSSVSHDFVLVVLGAKWLEAIPLIQWLALYALAFAINACMGPSMLLVPGGERRAMVLNWIRVAYTIPAVAAAGVLWGVQAVAVAITIANFVFMPLLIHQLIRLLPVTAGEFVRALWPPALAAAVMAVAVRLVELPGAPAVLSLAVDVAVGALVYSLALTALWHLAGRPNGPERAVIEFLAVRTMGRLRS